MANYNESAVSGTKWQRCKTVTIKNNYGRLPVAIFEEEIVTLIDSNLARLGNDSCILDFDAENGSIDLLNPETGAPLGTTCTHTELYVILYSLYMQAATARDALRAQQ
jgi:hypothetical protein